MDELVRSKMHEALDVEQPDSGLRSRILSSLPADGRAAPRYGRDRGIQMGRRTELAAAFAAVLLAAIVVGSFAYIRAVTRPHTVTPPITSPSPRSCPPYMGLPSGQPCPTPLSEPLNVGPTTPVILFSDRGNPQQIDGLTWDGQVAGKVTQIPATVTNQAGSSNPAGTLIAMFPDIFDRSGHVVATLQGGPYADPGVGEYFVGTWADDELHYCQVVPIFGGTSAVAGTLQLTTPGGKPGDVAHIGQQAPGENTLTVSMCSVLADRAVVVQADPNSGVGGPNQIFQYWVVQLSTGRVLWTHNLSGHGVTSVVSSPDGRYVAEVPTSGASTIYGPSGSAVGHVNGLVEAFSWDGSLAVVVANGGANVVRWNDGTVVWTVPSGEGLSGFQPEPGGPNFAIRTVNGALYVVSASGRVLAQRDVPGLLGCLPAQCASIPASAQAQQVLPTLMVGDVGWANAYQRTTDGAVHWQDVSPPAPANPTKGGNADFELDPNHAWVTQAVGAGGQPSATGLVISATADGGQTWSQASVPMSGAATDSARLGFLDANHGWLVTDSGATAFDKTNASMVTQPITRAVYATTDGGHTWTLLTTAHEGDGSTLGTLGLTCSMNGLTFTSFNDGWLTWDSGCGIGSTAPPPQPPSASTSAVAVTHDGGRSWQRVNLPSLPSSGDHICTVHQAVFTSSRGVLPVDCGGINVAGFSGVYETTDSGRTWSFRKLPVWSQQLDFIDANTGWTFGTPGVSLYRTTDGGRTWVIVKQFVGEQNFGGLSFVSPMVGFAITARHSPNGNSGYSTMWKTTDGGSTWSVMSTLPTGGGCC